MKQYIGTKIVEAEPATLYELKEGGHYLKKHSEEWTKENARIPDLASSKREGYAVLRAYSGTEAVLLLERQRPDLVLLDLMPPRPVRGGGAGED